MQKLLVAVETWKNKVDLRGPLYTLANRLPAIKEGKFLVYRGVVGTGMNSR